MKKLKLIYLSIICCTFYVASVGCSTNVDKNMDASSVESKIMSTNSPTKLTTKLQINQKNNTPLNNGGAVIRHGEYTYYISNNLYYENYRKKGSLYSVNSKGISKKLANIGGNHLWLVDDFLYVSEDNLSIFKTFKINPSNVKSSLLFKGNINYYSQQNNAFYFTGYDNQNKEPKKFKGIYKYDLGTHKIEKIFNANNSIYCKYLNILDNKLYYFTLTKDNTVCVNSYDLKSSKTIIISIEKPDNETYTEDYLFTIPQLSSCGRFLVYTYGLYQGSGHYFYGKMYKINPDGTEKTQMDILCTGNFFTYDIWIYYTDSDQEIDSPSYIMHIDMSDKQRIDNYKNIITISKDGWLFYNNEKGDIHRSRIDGNSDSLILKANKLPNYMAIDDHFRYTLDFVDDLYYIYAEVWGYRSNASWRDQFINSSFNRINVNGEGFQTLSQIYSPYSAK